MQSIELYKRYLQNSTFGVELSNKIKKLRYEAEQIREILRKIDHLREDESIFDKKDHSIYASIKRDIYESSCKGARKDVIQLARMLLTELLAQIEKYIQNLAA